MRSRLYFDLPRVTKKNNYRLSQQTTETEAFYTDNLRDKGKLTEYFQTQADIDRINDFRIAGPSYYEKKDYITTPVKLEDFDWLEQYANMPDYRDDRSSKSIHSYDRYDVRTESYAVSDDVQTPRLIMM